MSTVYKNILDLCHEKGISPSKMSTEAGISRSIMTELKSGRTKQPSADTLKKISLYFNVPVEYLLDIGTPNESDAPPEPVITDDQLMFALWGDVKDEFTEEDLEDVKKYAAFVKQRKLNMKNKED